MKHNTGQTSKMNIELNKLDVKEFLLNESTDIKY